MQVSRTIKSISNYLLEHSLESARDVHVLSQELKSIKNALKAMRTVVSMTQQGYDMNFLLNDVLKTIDTDKYELKLLCNYYLLRVCFDRPACQLMCIHTFLKDFNSPNIKIQKLAIIDAVTIADEILVKNCINELKSTCFHSNYEVRATTAQSLALIYIKNSVLFMEENLLNSLNTLLNDNKMTVRIAALRALGQMVEVNVNGDMLYDRNEIIKLAMHFYDIGKVKGIHAALFVLKNCKVVTSAIPFYLTLIKSNDICVFHLAAHKLLEHAEQCNDSSLYQLVYNNCLFFMNIRAEQQYNLLSFIYSYVDKVNIAVSDFLVFESDETFIRKLKIQILLRAMKNLSEEERISGKKIIKQEFYNKNTKNLLDIQQNILYYAILYDVFIEELTIKSEQNANKEIKTSNNLSLNLKYTNESVLERLVELNTQNSDWIACISNFLYKCKEANNEHVFLKLAAKFSKKIPKLIFKLETNANVKLLCYFYVKMVENGVITEQQGVNYIKSINKKLLMNGFTNIVLENFQNITSDDLDNEYLDMIFEHKDMQKQGCFQNIIDASSIKDKIKEKEESVVDSDAQEEQQVHTCFDISRLQESQQLTKSTRILPENDYLVANNEQATQSNNTSNISTDINDIIEKDLNQASFIALDIDNQTYNDGIDISNRNEAFIIENENIEKFENINHINPYTQNLTPITLTNNQNLLEVTEKVTVVENTKVIESVNQMITDSFNSKLDLKDNTVTPPKPRSTQFPIYVDSNAIKGSLELIDNKIVLKVDILEKSVCLEATVGNSIHNNIIRSEGKYTIGYLKKLDKFIEFKITIGENTFEGIIERR